ncbi:MAG: hypothetical protein K1X72_20865 [Pyrinomonadaceae bacterium]|nr:hypothetical protein [Pyrinomonadaceae bacterium]
MRNLQEQYWQIADKIAADGFNYGKVILPKVITTYLMRVIAYRINYSDIA